MFKNVKGERVPKDLRYIIVSWSGWIVNLEGYCSRRFKNVKRERVSEGLIYIIISWFGWVVNLEGYGLMALSTDWIVCSIILGASETNEDLVFKWSVIGKI